MRHVDPRVREPTSIERRDLRRAAREETERKPSDPTARTDLEALMVE